MNTELWSKIENFDMNGPVSEYGFTTRLENENYWTLNFARTAILEYKKFMYLAAISEGMVSPSDIVDVVWHQHLVFTESYEALCNILGKKIAHIPSTHHSDDFSKFKLASNRTQKLYAENFGEQPTEIWDYDDIYAPLNMAKATITIDQVIAAGVVLMPVALGIAYFALRPLYVNIGNPDFIWGYIMVIITTFIGLVIYNMPKLKAMVNDWPGNSFAFTLTALEVVYLQKNSIDAVIHGVVNQLVRAGNITPYPNKTLTANAPPETNDPVLYCAFQTISSNPQLDYPALVNRLKLKPAFNKTARAMDAFNKHIRGSKQFVRLFIVNFVALSIVLLLGAVRLTTGLLREKPVTIISGVVIVCLILMVINLYWLTKAIGNTVLPKFYNKAIVPEDPRYDDWDWNYFFLGNAVFASSFSPLTSYNSNDWSSGSSDSGSSCGGSSCGGSSCGGCGGGE
jgi:uncharacterized protein (TIGR04222 family)